MSWLLVIASNIVLASVLAIIAGFVEHGLRRPAIARVVWLLVLVKLVTPPLVSVALVDVPDALACSLALCNCPQHAGTFMRTDQILIGTLLTAWLSGACVVAWSARRRWTLLRRLMAHARPAPAAWQSLAASLSTELGIRCPEILTVPGRLPPLVLSSARRPRVLLPGAFINELNVPQRAALLLHELSHIKRGDHWVRLLELTVSVVYWWLPVTAIIGRRLRACEETCSDAAVVARLPQARRDYARLLLDVVDFAAPLPRQTAGRATAMSAAAHDLENRLHAILDLGGPPVRRWPAAVVAVGLACAILPCELRCVFARGSVDSSPPPTAAGAASLTNRIGNLELPSMCCPSS